MVVRIRPFAKLEAQPPEPVPFHHLCWNASKLLLCYVCLVKVVVGNAFIDLNVSNFAKECNLMPER